MSLWVRSDSALWVYTENLSIDRYYWACYFGMASGALLFLISFTGCMGTLLDSRLLFGIVSTSIIIMLHREDTSSSWLWSNQTQNSSWFSTHFSLAHTYCSYHNSLPDSTYSVCLALTGRRSTPSRTSLRVEVPHWNDGVLSSIKKLPRSYTTQTTMLRSRIICRLQEP